MKLSKSEAGKLGYQNAKEKFIKYQEERKIEYYKKPSICLYCGKVLDFEHRRRTFCSTKCSNFYRSKNKIASRCLFCNNELHKKNGKYCSTQCQINYQRKIKWEEWEKTGKFPFHFYQNQHKEVSRSEIKPYLEHKYGHKCQICGISEWLGKPILLIVDHIDGDMLNNNIDNYRLICSNCDATLDTYKNKNKSINKGRSWRVVKSS